MCVLGARVSEVRFWRNYFYRVHLLRQALELQHTPSLSLPTITATTATAVTEDTRRAEGVPPHGQDAAAVDHPVPVSVSVSGHVPVPVSVSGHVPVSGSVSGSGHVPVPMVGQPDAVQAAGEGDWELEIEKELQDAPPAAAPEGPPQRDRETERVCVCVRE
jgi:hypothetical protein